MEWLKALLEFIKDMWPNIKIGILFLSIFVIVGKYVEHEMIQSIVSPIGDYSYIFGLVFVFMVGIYIRDLGIYISNKKGKISEEKIMLESLSQKQKEMIKSMADDGNYSLNVSETLNTGRGREEMRVAMHLESLGVFELVNEERMGSAYIKRIFKVSNRYKNKLDDESKSW